MTLSFSAARQPTADAASPRTVVILAFDEVTASDISSAADVFAVATRFHQGPRNCVYRVVVASVHGQPITSFSGMTIATTPLSAIDPASIETLMVPGGGPPEAPPVPRDVVEWLAREGRKARRLCGICTGTFLLAEAGLVGHRRVTTHWQATEALKTRYPRLRVEPDRGYLHDDGLWTSGGFTAGLDLGLALLEEDQGHATTMAVARSLLLFVKRPGDHAQVSAALSSQAASDRQFSLLHAWIMDHLDEDLRVEVLAEQAGMSPRTFARHYTRQTGRTPAKAVEAMRMEAALRELNDAGASLKQVARRCGFGNEQNLRRTFLRLRGTTPEHYSQLRPGLDGAAGG
ncbi:GlxA family transcriptional regulator [Burkholderia ambifaria]|uniref:GlxA family transcriptional regulator n=1 Tax=Burkholderia ambifaria TaxID=152480 RepID=UPI00158C04F3|nr:DJ-1/PfpI family protein [Burkholderia ambifaria]